MPPNMSPTAPIFILKNIQDWPKWNLQIVQNMKKRGFTHLLKDKNQPKLSPELLTWTRQQKTACAIVISRLDPRIAKAMQAHKTLETLLQAIDNFTRPTGEEALEVLCNLWTRLASLSASKHTSISDYCAEAVDVKTQYQRLGCGIADAVLVSAFLNGLPLKWQRWKSQKMRNQNILLPWTDSASSTLTFSSLVHDALEEEARLYRTALRAEEMKWGIQIKEIRGDSATVFIDFCTSCNGVFHKAVECHGFRLHSQLRRARKGIKRRRQDSRGAFARTWNEAF